MKKRSSLRDFLNPPTTPERPPPPRELCWTASDLLVACNMAVGHDDWQERIVRCYDSEMGETCNRVIARHPGKTPSEAARAHIAEHPGWTQKRMTSVPM